MRELLAELSLPRNAFGEFLVYALFASCVLFVNLTQFLLWELFGSAYVALHLAAWGAWFFWQGTLFLRGRRAALERGVEGAYRRAFFSHICPGVSIGVAQMTCPVFRELWASGAAAPAQLTLGACLSLGGAALMVAGFRTIGLARAGFLTEFRAVERPVLQSRVYRWVRHPLFSGGALLSMGGTLLFESASALAVALLNLAILPVYQRIEDYRLSQVFGEEYVRYARSVGGLLPRAQGSGSWWRPLR